LTIQLPESADEYLALGVESEEAGEKWRMGDAAKSARFFVRALEIYAKGLEKHPRSFDLAYNKYVFPFPLRMYRIKLAKQSLASCAMSPISRVRPLP